MTRIHFAGENLSETKNRLAIALGLTGDDSQFPETAAHAKKRGWSASSLEEADLVVYGLRHRPGPECEEVSKKARARDLPCIFFRPNDDPAEVDLSWGWIYRTSIYRSRMRPCERAMPAFVGDLSEEVGGMETVGRGDLPAIGFCGFVGSRWNRILYKLTGRREKVHGLALRDRTLRLLRRSSQVEPRFIERTRFNASEVKDADPRKEFLTNLSESPYALSLRGMGNYSFRFYEILSIGRIPVFVDTDCALPFADRIDWKRHCVWVDESDLDRVGEILAQFHADRSDDDLRELQVGNRQLWLDWLCPESFYDHMITDALSASRDQLGRGLEHGSS